MERFLNLQMEHVRWQDYASHSEASNDVNDYSASFCNNTRLHAPLGNLPPHVFEEKMADKKTYLSA
jgi:putative transposase